MIKVVQLFAVATTFFSNKMPLFLTCCQCCMDYRLGWGKLTCASFCSRSPVKSIEISYWEWLFSCESGPEAEPEPKRDIIKHFAWPRKEHFSWHITRERWWTILYRAYTAMQGGTAGMVKNQHEEVPCLFKVTYVFITYNEPATSTPSEQADHTFDPWELVSG